MGCRVLGADLSTVCPHSWRCCTPRGADRATNQHSWDSHSFKRFLEPFPGMRDGREGGEQQGEGEVSGGVRLLPKAPGLPHASSSFPTHT